MFNNTTSTFFNPIPGTTFEPDTYSHSVILGLLLGAAISCFCALCVFYGFYKRSLREENNLASLISHDNDNHSSDELGYDRAWAP